MTSELDEDLVADCTPALDDVADELEPAGIPVECRKIRGTSMARALHETAEAEDAGLFSLPSWRSCRSAPGTRCASAPPPSE